MRVSAAADAEFAGICPFHGVSSAGPGQRRFWLGGRRVKNCLPNTRLGSGGGVPGPVLQNTLAVLSPERMVLGRAFVSRASWRRHAKP